MTDKFNSLPNRTLLRCCIDATLTSAAVILAFAFKVIADLLTKSPEMAQQTSGQLFNTKLFFYVLIAVASTIISFTLLGLYKKKTKRSTIRPLLAIGAASLPPLILTQILFLTPASFTIPRGALVYFWFFNILLLATPRLLKHYLTRKLKFEISRSSRKTPRNILVVGGAGYVGSHLCHELINSGCKVRVLDSMMFGDSPIAKIKNHPNFELVTGDFRNVETLSRAVKNMDAVVHLAGIVGDPACSVDDDFTMDVNLTSTSMIAEVCKSFGVERFVFASTCSVYGQSDGDHPLTESSKLNPVSLYARTKIASEEVLSELRADNFHPTFLRFATLFGLSPRPRFDLVVNILAARAATIGNFNVFGGNQWRPFVHVKDTAIGIMAVLNAPLEKVSGEAFNIGSNENNYKIVDVGKKITDILPETKMVVDDSMEDNRNYFVSFDKLNKVLGVKLERDLDYGINEIINAFHSGELTDYTLPTYSNLKQTEKLVSEVNSHESSGYHKKTAMSRIKQLH